MNTPVLRRQLLQAGAAAVLLAPTLGWSQAKPEAKPLGSAINRAGKMRALSQRSSRAYVQSTLGVLPEKAQDTIAQTQRSLQASLAELQQGSQPAELQRLLQALDKDNAALTHLVTAAPRKDAVTEVARAADAVLESADRVTKAYEALAQQGSARVINTAGRQRMLSQRAARAYFMIASGQDSTAVRSQLDSARAEFSQGLALLKSAPLSTAAIRNELELARGQWLFYEAALNRAPGSDSLQTVATTSERIYEAMDNLTAMYEAALREALG